MDSAEKEKKIEASGKPVADSKGTVQKAETSNKEAIEKKVDVSNDIKEDGTAKKTASNDAEIEGSLDFKNSDAEKAANEKKLQENVFVPLDAPEFEGDICESVIEKRRQEFNKGMKKSRNISTISMGIIIAGLVGGYFMYMYLPDSIKWLAYILFGILAVGVVVSLVFSSRSRKKLYSSVDDFVSFAIKSVDSYAFAQDGLSNPQVSRSGHANLDDVTKAHYFDTINAINSRNIVKAEYLGKTLQIEEIAARVPYQAPLDVEGQEAAKKSKKTPTESYGIFGKYVTYPLELGDGQDFIVLLRGINSYIPTYLDGYQEIKVAALNSSFMVWAVNEEKAQKLFENTELTAALNSFVPDMHLENIFLSVNYNGLMLSLNYNETVMEVPLETHVVGQPYLHYKNDIRRVMDVIKALKK